MCAAAIEGWKARIAEIEASLEVLHGGVELELDEFNLAKTSVLGTLLTAHARSTIAACNARNEVLQRILDMFWEDPHDVSQRTSRQPRGSAAPHLE